MDRITLDQLRQTFIERHPGWCVSLFMPTHRAGRDTEQDPIRFKNLLRQVEEQLQANGMRTTQLQDFLKAPQRLLQDQGFWRRQSDGLAVFFAEDVWERFRLPIAFAELTVISDRFHVKPLLPLLSSDAAFSILALSQNQLRLLEGTRHTVEEIDLQNVPQHLSEILPDGFPEKQLQFHTGTPSGSGNRPAMFHGHDLSNELKERIRQWFRLVDKEIRHFLPDGPAPLVLAGVDALLPLYKEVSSYPHLMEAGIPGNPEGLRPEELHQKAWAIVGPVFEQERQASVARYRQLAGTGRTLNEVGEVVLAARHGRIELLFVAVGVQAWGRVDAREERVFPHQSPEPGDEDLLDYAAIHTLLNGGAAYAVAPREVPDETLVAAVLRY